MSARKRKCPTPNKVQYATRSEANNTLRRATWTHPLYSPIRSYRCKGHYHITSRPR